MIFPVVHQQVGDASESVALAKRGHGRLLKLDRDLGPEQCRAAGLDRRSLRRRRSPVAAPPAAGRHPRPCRRPTLRRRFPQPRERLVEIDCRRASASGARFQQSGERGELPGGVAALLLCRLADRPHYQVDAAAVGQRSRHRQQRLEQGRGRGRLAWPQQVGKQRRHMRQRRAQDRRSHPRVVAVASRRLGERLARGAIPPIAEGERDLEANARIGIVRQPDKAPPRFSLTCQERLEPPRSRSRAPAGPDRQGRPARSVSSSAIQIRERPDRLHARLGSPGLDRQLAERLDCRGIAPVQ